MKKRRPHSPQGISGTGKAAAAPPATGPASAKKGWGAAPYLAIGLLAVGAAVFFIAAFEDTTVERELQPASDLAASAYNLGNQAAAKPFPYYDSVEEARPLPVTLPPSTYSNETLQTTYAIAKEIPEVLVQLPCLCGCHGASEDHGSLLDCYVDNHAAT